MRLYYEGRARLERLLNDPRLATALEGVMKEGPDRVVLVIKDGSDSSTPSAVPAYVRAAKPKKMTEALLAGLNESAKDKRALLEELERGSPASLRLMPAADEPDDTSDDDADDNGDLMSEMAADLDPRTARIVALRKQLAVLDDPWWAIEIAEEEWSCLTETGKDAALATALALLGATYPDDSDAGETDNRRGSGEDKPPRPWVAKFPSQSVPAIELIYGTAWWEQHLLQSSGDAAAANGEAPALVTLRDAFGLIASARERLRHGTLRKGAATDEIRERVENLHAILANAIADFTAPKVR